MKSLQQHMILVVLLLPLIIALSGCSKSDDPPPARDYAELFKNTVWTGEVKDSAARIRPYSMEFVVGNAFVLHVQNGDYVGSFVLDHNNISFSVPGLSAKWSASISDENTFTELRKTGSQNWNVLNGEFNVMTDQLLDDTGWSGEGEGGREVEFTFMPNSEIRIESELRIMYRKYTRRAGVIRCSVYGNDNFFLVLQNNNKLIKGAWFTDLSFQVTLRP